MPAEITPLAAGLYFVATPLGAARDITLRALDVLASADVLAAEDTRTLKHLMQLHGIALGDRPVVAYHDHNGAEVRPRLIRALAEGKSVAYASEAGTPLVADPGFPLARAAVAEGLPVVPVPGPSAVMAALTVAGLPTDRFLFAGFPPAAKGARRSWMEEIATVPATLVMYESPKRVHRTLDELCEIAGRERQAAICRELTKRFEETLRGSLGELAALTAERRLKGEIVLVVARGQAVASAQDMETALREALQEMSVKDAAAAVAGALGLPKRQVYQAALEMEKTR
ncbi:16S rRNA (cytidine(1402)-2'-O)-methyltransferase [Psychromarinibacter sp. C21-152]|uniref:Ribosomal RNA small subunit methyltransferase I n=1 Tax=Psychromarinibacter sediminicola TaxID=3033385 RepID=A0AAE3NVU0_9RHOB|nr:16S rRNA (cytidine(1402)-2'-O)-methyltransferase [Psychromarinibacter sediminicola]MDF0603041.1 16S rRNA (cytidine(1402)-2'-O)-methyltransferase [Psychromarinibacter sediminicola]